MQAKFYDIVGTKENTGRKSVLFVLRDAQRKQHDAKSLRLVVYVPGVAAAGVDITARGPDISVTAVKERFVRENWISMQLERVQHDYQLRLRIGYGYDLAAMTAEIENGVLTIALPKRESVTAAAAVTLPAASRLAAAAAV